MSEHRDRFRAVAAAALMTTVGTVGPAGAVPPEAVYLNGRIYTVDAQRPWVEALAVRDGRIAAVGSTAEVAALAGPATAVVDLEGRMVMPAVHDMHVHPMEAGLKELYECSFQFSLPLADILDAVQDCAADLPPGRWLRGGQWPTELLQSDTVPDKTMLDAVVSDRPVFLLDSAFHGAWLNSLALERLGITKDTPDPEGGLIMRDRSTGEPTGVLLDNAAYSAMRDLPPYSDAQYRAALRWSVTRLNAAGVTVFRDAVAGSHTLRGYRALDDAGELRARVATSLIWKGSWVESHEQELANIARRDEYTSANIHTDFAKIFVDGIPPSGTGAFLEPYQPALGRGAHHRGKLIHEPARLRADVVELDRRGLSVKMHATGDRAVRVALDAVAAARRANGASGRLHEIAHAEAIHPDDLPRFAALGVVAEMSPILWYPSPLVDAMIEVLGEARVRHWWPIRSLTESGALVVYGSDWPSVVPTPSPWPGIEAMVTRRDPYGKRPGTIGPDEAVDLATAVRIFTLNGARSVYLDGETGSLEVGKSADFIVLDRNLFEIPAESIGDTRVLRTVFRGVTIYPTESVGPAGEPD